MKVHPSKLISWWNVPKRGESLITYVMRVEREGGEGGEGGGSISDNELDLCSVIIATNILYKSWKQAGAVCNATLEELKAARMVIQKGRTVVIIGVAEHKTGREGHAKLLLLKYKLAEKGWETTKQDETRQELKVYQNLC